MARNFEQEARHAVATDEVALIEQLISDRAAQLQHDAEREARLADLRTLHGRTMRFEEAHLAGIPPGARRLAEACYLLGIAAAQRRGFRR